MNGRRHDGLFESRVFGHVDGHFELGQNVLGYQERLVEHLVQHSDGDVPVTEHGRLGQLEFGREHPAGGQGSTPVFHAVTLAVLLQQNKL